MDSSRVALTKPTSVPILFFFATEAAFPSTFATLALRFFGIATVVAARALLKVADTFFEMLGRDPLRGVLVALVAGIFLEVRGRVVGVAPRRVVPIEAEILVVSERRRTPTRRAVTCGTLTGDLLMQRICGPLILVANWRIRSGCPKPIGRAQT